LPFSFFKKSSSLTNKAKRQVIALALKSILAYNTILCYVRVLCRKLFVNLSKTKSGGEGQRGEGNKIQRNYFVSFRSSANGGSTATITNEF